MPRRNKNAKRRGKVQARKPDWWSRPAKSVTVSISPALKMQLDSLPGPPPHWNGTAKIDWNKIPAPLRESIAKDYEAIAPMRELAPVLQQYTPLLQQRYGGNIAQGVGAVMQLYSNAIGKPVDFIRDFCQQFNIDPQTLGGTGQPVQGQQVQEQPDRDPYAPRFQQIETALQHLAQQPVIHQQNQIQSDIQKFQTAIKPDGSVEHPYFNDVRAHMASLMQTPGGPTSLNDAYEQACWAVPAIRAELQREATAKATDQRKQAVAKAQLAGGSITGSPGVARAETHVSQSVRADLLKNWDAQEARV
jgi:hypothetical protein